jgi:FG-GAP-like repeat/Bacterial Ig domain/FG-GAP repeat
MCSRFLPVLLVSMAAAPVFAQVNPSFELSADNNFINAGSNGMVAGDFNNDGKPDYLVTGSATSQAGLTLRLGNGDGTFQAPINYGTASGSLIGDMAAADFDRDGNLDIVTGNDDGTFQVFYGNGAGRYESVVSVATQSTNVTSIAVGDFNNDGYPDIALTDENGAIEIYKSASGKDFVYSSTITLPGQSLATRIRAASLRNNGIVDLAVLSEDAAYVLWGDGSGNFKPVSLAAYTSPADLNIGDVNQDGMADIIVSSSCTPPPSEPPAGRGPYSTCAAFDVFYGQATQTTIESHIINDPGPGAAGQPYAVDVNGDGVADIVASARDTNNSQSGLFVWLGHPNGVFDQTPQRYISNTDGYGSLVAADFNRDGMMDFVQMIAGNTENYINGGVRAPCATSTVSPTVTVCQPVDGTYTPSPVNIQANAYDKNTVTALQEYIDGSLAYSQDVTSFNLNFSETPGTHLFVTKAWDASGRSFRSDRTITVYSGTPGPTCAAALGTASLCLPAGTTTTSPVQMLGNGYSSYVPTAAQLYIDGTMVVNNEGYCYQNGNCAGGTSFINTTQTLSAGRHDIVFKLWDADGDVYTAEKTLTVSASASVKKQ